MENQNQNQDEEQSALDPFAEATIAEMIESGIPLTLADQIAINDAARRVTDCSHDVEALGTPVLVGNDVWFWPLTVQACRWIVKASKWVDTSDELTLLVNCYAYAHSRGNGIFEYLADARTGVEAVLEWADGLGVSYSELVRGLELITASDEDDTTDDDPQPKRGASLSGVVTLLVEKTGVGPDYWESKASLKYLVHQAYAIIAQSAAGGKTTNPHDPYMMANKAMARVEQRIKEAHGVA